MELSVQKRRRECSKKETRGFLMTAFESKSTPNPSKNGPSVQLQIRVIKNIISFSFYLPTTRIERTTVSLYKCLQRATIFRMFFCSSSFFTLISAKSPTSCRFSALQWLESSDRLKLRRFPAPVRELMLSGFGSTWFMCEFVFCLLCNIVSIMINISFCSQWWEQVFLRADDGSLWKSEAFPSE